jgi:hypothetical protein
MGHPLDNRFGVGVTGDHDPFESQLLQFGAERSGRCHFRRTIGLVGLTIWVVVVTSTLQPWSRISLARRNMVVVLPPAPISEIISPRATPSASRSNMAFSPNSSTNELQVKIASLTPSVDTFIATAVTWLERLPPFG